MATQDGLQIWKEAVDLFIAANRMLMELVGELLEVLPPEHNFHHVLTEHRKTARTVAEGPAPTSPDDLSMVWLANYQTRGLAPMVERVELCVERAPELSAWRGERVQQLRDAAQAVADKIDQSQPTQT